LTSASWSSGKKTERCGHLIKDEYSPYKIVHHCDRLEQLKRGEQTVPIQIQLVPSNVCNQGCSFCAYRIKGSPSSQIFDPRQMLDTLKVYETVDCFAEMGGKAIHVTGGGEPLVHPDITHIFDYILNSELDLALVTNGSRLTPDMCAILADSSWVRVSVDSGNSETYSALRNTGPNEFDKVVSNVEKLVEYKNKNIIGIGFVVVKENYSEIVQAARLFKDIGVDNLRISAAFVPQGAAYFKPFFDEAHDLAQAAQELSDDYFHVFNLFDDRIHDMFDGTQDYGRCPSKDLISYVGADYNVYTCCTLAYNKKGLVGSIKDQTYKELWESREKRGMFINHSPMWACRIPCMYENKNHFINYCISSDPKHINFI